jgi:hypothetical protein
MNTFKSMIENENIIMYSAIMELPNQINKSAE